MAPKKTNVYAQHVFIFLTEKNYYYKYRDEIRRNNGTTSMLYDSQKSWRVNDDVLKDDSKEIHIFVRESSQQPFKYLGKVVTREVQQERTRSNILRMKFTVNTLCRYLCTPGKIFAPMPGVAFGKYKEAVIRDLGVIPLQRNYISVGIVQVLVPSTSL